MGLKSKDCEGWATGLPGGKMSPLIFFDVAVADVAGCSYRICRIKNVTTRCYKDVHSQVNRSAAMFLASACQDLLLETVKMIL